MRKKISLETVNTIAVDLRRTLLTHKASNKMVLTFGGITQSEGAPPGAGIWHVLREREVVSILLVGASIFFFLKVTGPVNT